MLHKTIRGSGGKGPRENFLRRALKSCVIFVLVMYKVQDVARTHIPLAQLDGYVAYCCMMKALDEQRAASRTLSTVAHGDIQP